MYSAKYSTNAIEVFRHFQNQSKVNQYEKIIKENDFTGIAYDKE